MSGLTSFSVGRVAGLSDSERDLVDDLLQRLSRKTVRNRLRTKYYDAKQTVRHLGISVPPQLESIETVLGWPAKSVDDLEQRIDFDGFVLRDGSWDDFGLDVIWDDNRLALEASQAHASALKYSVSFVAVLAGEAPGPAVVVRPLSALSTIATWDSVRRRVKDALTVTGSDDLGGVSEFILFTDESVVTCAKADGRWRVTERTEHILGRSPVAVLPFKPDMESPFGASRISRAVMSITDRAVRSLLRMEVSAEFYSSPQRYVLGADEAAFTGPNGEPRTGWEVTLGKLLALQPNEEGDNPTVGQFPQMTMQPHMDMVRADAALFAGETGIPVNSLGIIHDNPASEAAMQTAYLPLVKTAERASVPFGIGWVDAMQMAVQVRDGVSVVPDGLRGMRAKFRDPATSTRTEMANATSIFVSTFPWATDSDVTLEMFGLDQVDIDRLKTDRERSQASSRLAQLTEAARGLRSGDIGAGGGVQARESGLDIAGSGAVAGLSE